MKYRLIYNFFEQKQTKTDNSVKQIFVYQCFTIVKFFYIFQPVRPDVVIVSFALATSTLTLQSGVEPIGVIYVIFQNALDTEEPEGNFCIYIVSPKRSIKVDSMRF